MPLSILSSNRVETLQASLAQRLVEEPLADPFAREIVVVPTFAMARWLNLRLAQSQGIAANLHYPQPAQWIWELATDLLDDLPRRDPFSRDNMAWRLFALLPMLQSRPGFEVLAGYLADDDSGIKRWQLAQRIAESFDHCQSCRPQLVRAWGNGEQRQWQAQLWRALVDANGESHRLAIIARLVEELQREGVHAALPPRISLFALSTLAPLYLEALRALAAQTELCLYLHSPSDQYWADLESEKRRARRRLSHPGQHDLFAAGNELLAAWGRQGQEFQDLLLERAGDLAFDNESFEPPAQNSLLGQVQRSIFSLEAKPRLQQADDSIGLHVCHSPMRECEVLQDRLLDMLQQDESLEPENILVMIPDIAGYAPYVEAVFRRGRLPFNLADVSLADEHPLVMTFLQLLNLPASRFTLSEILSLLENPALQLRFELDSASLLEIRRLVEQGHTRWGIDAHHKTDFELPATAGNTWQQLNARFFAGFALAGDELWHGIAPLTAGDDASSAAIGRFWHFLDRLRSWRERLSRARPAAQWQALLMRLLDDFFVEPEARESKLQQIRDAIAELGSAGDSEISSGLLAYLMQRLLQNSEQSGQLYSGGITFCGMRPMRSIPFRIICLLGMNRNDFPRRDPPNDIELSAEQTRPGDPQRRVEDRYLMLETLLCARQRLYLSYTGRSLKDNSELQPSVLVQELMDFIDAHFDDAEGDARPSAALTQVHSMQAFSTANFDGAEPSYSDYWCRVAQRLEQDDAAPPRPWPLQSLPAGEQGPLVELEQLRRFAADPVRYFFNRRLGIYIRDDDVPDDDEPFVLAGLEAWRLKQQLATDCIAGREPGIARLRAEGLLPHGQAAEAQVERLRGDLAGLLEAVADYADTEARVLTVEVDIDGGNRLTGAIGNFYPGRGLMHFHAGRFKGSRLLGLWIDQLALCAARLPGCEMPAMLVTQDRNWQIPPFDADAARAQLADYCALYRQGLDRPLPVFPEASYEWAGADDRGTALARVRRLWSNRRGGGDRGNPYLALVMQGGYREPFEDAGFDDCAARLYARLLAVAEKR
ncbi:MAG TPA: exodeoxyribonuclease V subunit gamma [Gammaproteobacteria bacterium]